MRAIAIDGPAGAGKSTMARLLARRLGYLYVDTGALYRAIGYFMVMRGADTGREEEVAPLLPLLSVELRHDGGEQRVFLNGEDISGGIRTERVSMAASAVSAFPSVRGFLLELQRGMAERYDVVMDGRDIGTVVLPNADLKLFLTAAPEDRARRRYEELRDKGADVDYAAVLQDLKARDYRDSHRAVSPLRPAEDAVVVDTTGNELRTSVDLLVNIVKENLS